MRKVLKKTLLLAMIVSMLLSLVVPASAAGAGRSPGEEAAPPAALNSQTPEVINTIKVPLSFDGSTPDSSQVELGSAPGAFSAFSMAAAAPVGPTINGKPEKVETTVAINTDTITITTADEYFVNKTYTIDQPYVVYQFAAQIEGLFNDTRTYEYDRYMLRLSNSADSEETVDLNIEPYNDAYYNENNIYYVRMSNIFDVLKNRFETFTFSSDNVTLEASLIEIPSSGADPIILSEPFELSFTYTNDNSFANLTNDYIRPDAMKFVTTLYTPGIIDSFPGGAYYAKSEADIGAMAKGDEGSVTVSLVKDGKTAMLNVDALYDDIYGYNESLYDTRYNDVFDCGYLLQRETTEINVELSRVADLEEGSYDMVLTLHGVPNADDTGTIDASYTYSDVVTVGYDPIVYGIETTSGDGFPPPTYGGNEVYAVAKIDGGSIDDFEISILDDQDNEIGKSTACRYDDGYNYDYSYDYDYGYDAILLFKAALYDNIVFEEDHSYYILLTYKGAGSVHYFWQGYNEYSESDYSGYNGYPGYGDYRKYFWPTNQYGIYDFRFNAEINVADYTIKAVNPPAGDNLVFSLYYADIYNGNYNYVKIADASVPPSEEMRVVFMNDETVLTLSPGSYYVQNDTGDFTFYFQVYDNGTGGGGNVEIQFSAGKPYIYETENSYNLNYVMSKDNNHIDDATTFSATFIDRYGNTVADQVGDIQISNEVYSVNDQEIPVARLQANYTFPAALTEGVYYIRINIINSSSTVASDPIIISIPCLKTDKAYGNGYMGLLGGYFYGPIGDSFSYDPSKFEFVLVPYLGEPITLDANFTEAYKDDDEVGYYITENFADVPKAFYSEISLKYDGHDIYNIFDPASPAWSFTRIDIEARTLLMNEEQSGSISSISVVGNENRNAPITAILYAPGDRTDFEVKGTLSLTRDPNNPNVYYITGAEGLVANAAYDAYFFCDGAFIGGFRNQSFSVREVEIVPVDSVSIDETLALKVGETAALTAQILPGTATYKSVSWESSAPEIVTVDANGLVTAVSAGTAVITVTAYGGKTDTCTVTVTENIASLSVVMLAYAGETTPITATEDVYSIDGAKFDTSKALALTLSGVGYLSTKSYSYAITLNQQTLSSGTVNGSELLSGKTFEISRAQDQSDGAYTYTITIKDGDTQVAAQMLKINISGTPIHVAGVSLNRSNLSLTAGKSFTLSAFVYPGNATNKSVAWSSSKPEVATVDTAGKVTAVTAGTAVITVTTQDGAKTASCTVKVGVDLTGILKYGDQSADNQWIYLLNSQNEYVGGTSTDSNGVFSFPNIKPGTYKLQSYSYERRYLDLDYAFTVEDGIIAKDLSEVSFTSKFSQASTLTVNIADSNGQALGYPFRIYLYNYDTGIYLSNDYDGLSTSATINDLPYAAGGSDYYFYVYASNDATGSYFYESTTFKISAETCSLDFVVPVRYAITGTVRDTLGSVVPYETVVAADGNNSLYYGYTDEQGKYTISNLSAGSYDVKLAYFSRFGSTTQNVVISNANMTADITAIKGLTVTGRLLNESGTPAYKAYVQLLDSTGSYVAGGYATGDGGFVFDGAIRNPGTYKFDVSYIYKPDWTNQPYIREQTEFTVSLEDITLGRLTKDFVYKVPVSASEIFAGGGNLVVTDKSVVHDGSSLNLVIKYKNNGNTSVDATFTAELPAGADAASGASFTVSGLAPGASGQTSIPLTIDDAASKYITIPVKVSIGGLQYDFGSVSLEYANITLNAPGAVKTTDEFRVYGEATQGSTVAIKNMQTGELLATAVTNGRWYSATIRPLGEGTYYLVAEAKNADVTALSQVVKVEAKADQITIQNVIANSAGSVDLPVNKLIGVRTFTAWVSPNLSGHSIDLAVLFANGESISSVTYHFSDLDYTAAKNTDGYWQAYLTGWSGAGLKTITATVITSDGRELTFIIAEVTVLVDPSGYVLDKETGNRLAGVTVVCEILDQGNWIIWDAAKYGQNNPQITDSDGNYGWMVPAGTYRVRAVMDGYNPYVTTDDDSITPIVIPPVRTDVNIALTPSVLTEKLELDTDKITLTAGNSKALTVTVTPLDATNAGNITWISSDTTVATVSGGTVTAIKAGTVTITAKIGTVQAACTVTVESSITPSVTLNKSSLTLTKGNSEMLIADVYPANAVITWTTDNASVATVSGGTVTAVSVGTATITAKVGDATAVCIVTVTESTGGGGGGGGGAANEPKIITADNSGKATIKAADLKNATTLTIKAGANVYFDTAATAALRAAVGDVTVTVKRADTSAFSAEAKALIGDRPVYDFSVTAGGKSVSDFGTGKIRVAIPYTPKTGEDANAIVIYYVDASGNLKSIQGCYNAATGSVEFVTTHFSRYAVGYNKVIFTDVKATAWYSNAITFLAARDVTSGTGNGAFSPDATLTRGQFLVMLMKAYGISPDAQPSDNFADAGNTYYTGYLAAAKRLGITTGIGGNNYAPDRTISRQDMFTLLYRTLNILQQLPVGDTGKKLSDFWDKTDIASYAKEAMEYFVKCGVVEGSNSMLKPNDTTTRAQMAQVLYKLLKL